MQSWGGLRFLVVEDDPAARFYMATLVRSRGGEVVETGEAEQAIAEAMATPPDFICLDLMLPSASGLHVCATLRARAATEHVAVLVISARTGVTDQAYAIEAGADGFLRKPFRKAEFIDAVNVVLTRRTAVAA